MKKRIFGKMLADYADVLSGHALNFTRDEDAAKDLLQHTFLKALDKYETYREDGNLGGWLYWIMRNSYINDFKKMSLSKISGRLVSDVSCAELLPGAALNLSEGTFVQRDIQHALAGISPIYAVAFVRHFEGYKYEEIAASLGIPVGTVKRRIHTARVQLQKALHQYSCCEN
ncbi:RNA polymerase sigma factor [Pedobacter aquatilis]|uniref:RNA polymerase sigma factor n=1 Tax=Pedobacter aquatilis TaxID=351343 RepID=UPI00292EE6B0|nr:RNA polymerase sigma factor [Pedobacter aquatilis]